MARVTKLEQERSALQRYKAKAQKLLSSQRAQLDKLGSYFLQDWSKPEKEPQE